MKFQRKFFFRLLLLVLTGIHSGGAAAQIVDGKPLVRAALLADTAAVVPGGDFSLGVLFEIEPGWHIYWRNPGDAGLATSVDWKMPEGFEISAMRQPVPARIVEPGDIQVFGYKKQVLLWVDVRAPADLQSGSEVRFSADASWLVCKEICVPGDAAMELTLPVAADAAPVNAELFAEFRELLPAAGPPPYELAWEQNPAGWNLRVAGIQEGARMDFYPFEAETDLPGHTSGGIVENGTASLEIPANRAVEGLLVRTEPLSTWVVKSPEWKPPVPVPAPADENTASDAAPPAGIPPLWLALLYGAIGGFILNFMPCVLPVISLKIFGFMRQAGDSRSRIFRHGLAFAGGMFAWFLGLGMVIVLLKQTGASVTWAFQFQNPWFILFICAVVFVFALNLFGVFEFALPGAAGSRMADLAEKEGYSGSFFQGVFATLLATPCTAPFLGTALGFAFSQPAPVILGMFGAVAFGMAVPYVLLSAQPAWIAWLPKPGAWMEKLKHFMAFPLLATLVWLLSVVAGQKGTDGVIWTLALLLALGFACWIYGAFRGLRAAGIALLAAGLGTWFFGGLFSRAEAPGAAVATPSKDGIPWVAFSTAELDRLLDEGAPVFVDFTADWCITCKFNERTAINTPAVRAVLAERGIVPMKADWTNANPEITNALREFGRVGVPFYVFYPKGRAVPPVVFPELLTEAILLDGLKK